MSEDRHESPASMDERTETGQAAELPPHLAARFYRRSSSRISRSRRSSAHSSRRSSISSRHSRTSALSSHGGPYSTHIAQHLRRASIIESRKARLAERAVHAEQVRLRAAAAKNTPRVSNTEEKALAAQAERERRLAEITARCEEQVRHAKRIAEETKARREEEHAKMKEDLAEKFADAERRRSVFLQTGGFRRNRTSSLAAVEEKKIDRTTLKQMGVTRAARMIQRTWRMSRIRRLAGAFVQAGISVDQFKSSDFDAVTKLVSTEDSMVAALNLAKYLGLLDNDTEEIGKRGAVRVLLSAFMIVAQPVQMFSHGGMDSKERELLLKAEALTKAIESTISAACSEKPLPVPKDQLQFSFQDFTSGFHAWKSQDVSVLVDVLVGSFVNLDLIMLSTRESSDGHVAADYLEAIQIEKAKLLARLKRLIGLEAATTKLRGAVRKARRERAQNSRPVSPNRTPRAATPVDVEMDLAPSVLLTPPATPSGTQDEPEQAGVLVSKLGNSMTVLPPNREIAHEILINGSYEIEQQPYTDARKDYMHLLKAGMQESMRHGGLRSQADWTGSMAILVKDKLTFLVTERHPLFSTIDNLLDPQLIIQQVGQGSFDHAKFFTAIGQIVSRLCSPGRDAIVQAFQHDEQSDNIERLFNLIHILDLMTLDHLNFRFRLVSKQILEHGHQHEYVSFEKDLADGLHTLAATKAWWRSGRAAIPPSITTSANCANATYSRSLTDLVLTNTPFSYHSLPETLRIDYMRLLKLRAKIFQVVAVSSILLTSKIRLRRNREALWSKEADRLMKLDATTTDVARIVSLIESSHMMPDSTRSGLIDFVSRVLPSASNAVNKCKIAEQERLEAIQSHRIFDPTISRVESEQGDTFTEQIASFILKSLREHIYTRLAASSNAEKARVAAGTSETLARIGMPEFVGEVGKVVDVLDRIRAVDLRAHEKWYDQVAAEVAAEAAVA